LRAQAEHRSLLGARSIPPGIGSLASLGYDVQVRGHLPDIGRSGPEVEDNSAAEDKFVERVTGCLAGGHAPRYRLVGRVPMTMEHSSPEISNTNGETAMPKLFEPVGRCRGCLST
jgi:hypothetical protein